VNIVFLDRGTLSPQTTMRPPSFAHQLVTYEQTRPEEVAGRITNADIVIVNKVRLTSDVIRDALCLKMVAVAATGTDNVDLQACAVRGVVVSNIRSYAANTVPEHTFALIFALRRSICAYRDSVLAGRWQASAQFCYFDYPIRDLAGSTLGVIGNGVLGKSVAAMGRALGMNVLISAHKGSTAIDAGYTHFEEVLERSDVITLHCPLNAHTRGLIGEAQFEQMKRRPLLINTARGGLVDEAALGPALIAGKISGAGFDVVSIEPPPADHPLFKLAARPDFILTPHVAWASDEAIQALTDQLVENIECFVRGAPRNIVRLTP
jgi:glycerate dehydrogenase